MSISEVLLALAGFAGGLIEIDLTTTRGLDNISFVWKQLVHSS